MVTLIHTSDWQLGKPFGQMEDGAKRAVLQGARLEALSAVGAVARDAEADGVVVCGDLFDSPLATRAVVCAALERIGAMGCPVYAIPGNHDHAGPGTVWSAKYFEEERQALAPNLMVLLEEKPVEVERMVLLPCPLRRRQMTSNPLDWLAAPEVWAGLSTEKPRVVLAHGSTQSFESDGEERARANFLDLSWLPEGEVDYVALGDWHGVKEVTPRAWYSGSPEPDRFPKGEDYKSGVVLRVRLAERGRLPEVEVVETGRVVWARLRRRLDVQVGLDVLERELETLFGREVRRHVVELELEGSLGLEAMERLRELLERFEARALDLRVANRVAVAPRAADLAALALRPSDPMIAQVAGRLKAMLESTGEGQDQAGSKVEAVDLSESEVKGALLALYERVRKEGGV